MSKCKQCENLKAEIENLKSDCRELIRVFHILVGTTYTDMQIIRASKVYKAFTKKYEPSDEEIGINHTTMEIFKSSKDCRDFARKHYAPRNYLEEEK